MLRNASVIDGYAIAASDGQVGTVSDFLFDDASWLVRWLVVDTGNWLSGRKVLLPASALGHLDQPERHFSVRLTMQQVKDSPDIYTDQPVSRQMETNIYDFYGWNPYWSTGYMGGAMAGPFTWNPYRACWMLPIHGETRVIHISAASKPSPGTMSMPATVRSVTSRTSSSRMKIGAFVTWSSLRRTGGPGRRF
jgi:hypothetical protein